MRTQKNLMRAICCIVACIALAALGFAAPAHAGQQERITIGRAELLWDTWGVPHIFADDDPALFYAFGYAQAHNHGDLLLKLFGEARGRAAETWGEAYLPGDRKWRTVGLYAEAERTYAALSPEWRGYVSAFAAGFNAYALDPATRDAMGEPWRAALPVTATDVIAHSIRVLRYEFIARAGFGHAANWEAGEASEAEPASGSNGWAIGPSRSADGRAMLVANPHQPWSDFGLWIEAHFVTPRVNLYGAALLGSPVLNIAFNDHLGWTHTVNTHDGWDLYRLTPTADGAGYVYDGEARPFVTREETLSVRGDDGTMREETLIIRESLHGPVIATRPDGEALALRIVAEDAFAAAAQWWEMGHARSLDEFETALRTLRLPMFNVIYADRDGNILMLHSEQSPIRAEGDWATWNNTTVLDNSAPAILPGEDSRWLWARDYHPYDDLPRLVNPPTGWVQNANEPPWTATLPPLLDPADYPAYIAPPPFVWPRPARSMRMLSEDDSITFDELLAYKQSTEAELADDLLDDLIAAARETARAEDRPRLAQAADVLAAWDRATDADSVGAALFTLWVLDYVVPRGVSTYAVDWDLADPFNTPRGLADPAGAVESLLRVANQLEGLRLLGIGMDVPYGDVFRLRVGEYDLPANGSYDYLGTFRILTFVPDDDLRFRPVHGDSYIAVVEFGAPGSDDPPRAQVLLSYGNATQPGSPHIGDQLELFAQKDLRDAWTTRAQVEANLASALIFAGDCPVVPDAGERCWSVAE